MKNLNVPVTALLIALSVLVAGPIRAQETQSCKIQILSPQKGDKVGAGGAIRGTASVPAGMYLWVFARKEGQRNWWPQGGGAAEVKTSSWVVDGVYGDENNPQKDAGASFEITGVVVDEEANAKLASYVETTNKTGRYPGTQLPPASKGGCSLKENLIVQRQ